MPLRLREPGLPLLTALAFCLAGPIAGDEADELTVRHRQALDDCYRAAGADGLADCKGALAEPCMATEEGGYSTVGMMSCTLAEAGVWSEFMEEEYRASLEWAERLDDLDRETFPEFANFAAALEAAQTAWSAYSDAECGVEYARWGAGSMRMIAGAACHLDMTVERTVALRVLREEM